jgi:hypothetical protein
MTIEQIELPVYPTEETSQFRKAMETLRHFQEMMKLVERFPIKENIRQPKHNKWELYPKYPKVSPPK